MWFSLSTVKRIVLGAPVPRIVEIVPGCFRLRVPFYIFFFDVGTHVNFVRLKSGKFLVLSAVDLAESNRAQIDDLTDGGRLMEAIVATNPFHTTAFPQWSQAYPDVPMYGTPRHLRNFPDIKWAGSVEDEDVRALWEPEVHMRIPAGCEFNAPTPELTNHFCGIIAFYPAGKIVICDDAFMVSAPKLFSLATLRDMLRSLKFFRKSESTISFHMAMPNQALQPTPKAARQFYDWVIQLTNDWDFDSMASAHGTWMVGGAKEALIDCLAGARKSLSDHSVKYGGDPI